MKYEFSVDFTWDTYELEEDFTMYLPVEVLDKSEITSYWEAVLSVLLILPILVLLGPGLYYCLKLRSKVSSEETD